MSSTSTSFDPHVAKGDIEKYKKWFNTTVKNSSRTFFTLPDDIIGCNPDLGNSRCIKKIGDKYLPVEPHSNPISKQIDKYQQ